MKFSTFGFGRKKKDADDDEDFVPNDGDELSKAEAARSPGGGHGSAAQDDDVAGGRDDVRPYRRGVGAVLFDAQGRVFVAERRDTPGAWQFPQGGIDVGESARAAVLREVAEEIGTTAVIIVDETEDWLRYDLPPPLRDAVWGGRFRGQEQKWFALRFVGEDEDIRLDVHRPPEFVRWRWHDFASVAAATVAFKRPVYQTLLERFRRFAAP